jgi:hypothetical protein
MLAPIYLPVHKKLWYYVHLFMAGTAACGCGLIVVLGGAFAVAEDRCGIAIFGIVRLKAFLFILPLRDCHLATSTNAKFSSSSFYSFSRCLNCGSTAATSRTGPWVPSWAILSALSRYFNASSPAVQQPLQQKHWRTLAGGTFGVLSIGIGS